MSRWLYQLSYGPAAMLAFSIGSTASCQAFLIPTVAEKSRQPFAENDYAFTIAALAPVP